MAAAAGWDKCSQSAIRSAEAGVRPLRLNEAAVLCQTLHVTLDWLVYGTRTPNQFRAGYDAGIKAARDAVNAL